MEEQYIVVVSPTQRRPSDFHSKMRASLFVHSLVSTINMKEKAPQNTARLISEFIDIHRIALPV